MDTVESLIRTKVLTVDPEDRVTRVALDLARTRSNLVLIKSGRKLVGCVPRKALLRPPLAHDTKAERLMSHPPTLEPGARIEDAASLAIQSGFDLLPVVEGGDLLGAVNARDIASEHPALPGRELTDAAAYLAPPLAIGCTIAEAAGRLRDLDMDSLPLAGPEGRLQGWISFGDVSSYVIAPERGVRKTGEFVGEKLHPTRNPASSIAHTLGLTVSPQTDVCKAISMLQSRRRNELTLIEGEETLGHLSVMGILQLTRSSTELLVQVAGLEDEDAFTVAQVIGNLRATADKVGRMCRNVETPELKVKTYEHKGSRRKRYEVRVTFSVPEPFVAEAKGWDLLSACQQATKRVEREIFKSRSKLIESHRRRRTRPSEEVQ